MQTVLVTGSSRGIGKAIAKKFGKEGYRVILNARHSEDELEAAQEELRKEGMETHAYLADMGDYNAVKAMFADMEQKSIFVDVLINNAGISCYGLLSEQTEKDIQNVISANLSSCIYCTKKASYEMVKRRSGAIVNISSIWGNVGASCEALYSATKGGMNAFTKAMAKELGLSGIRVNAVSCGFIDTEMNNGFSSEEKKDIVEKQCIPVTVQPCDVANICFFLASEEARLITGQIIGVDGGFAV